MDGFHPINVGRLSIGLPCFLSATPQGILELLRRYNVPTKGANCVVLGRSNIVGKPVASLMMQKAVPGDATVTVCHSRTRDIKSFTLNADIIIAALGQPGFLTADMVKKGDVDFENVAPKCSFITPVPGGVGPMTIVSLMKNTLLAARHEIYK